MILLEHYAGLVGNLIILKFYAFIHLLKGEIQNANARVEVFILEIKGWGVIQKDEDDITEFLNVFIALYV